MGWELGELRLPSELTGSLEATHLLSLSLHFPIISQDFVFPTLFLGTHARNSLLTPDPHLAILIMSYTASFP